MKLTDKLGKVACESHGRAAVVQELKTLITLLRVSEHSVLILIRSTSLNPDYRYLKIFCPPQINQKKSVVPPPSSFKNLLT